MREVWLGVGVRPIYYGVIPTPPVGVSSHLLIPLLFGVAPAILNFKPPGVISPTLCPGVGVSPYRLPGVY